MFFIELNLNELLKQPAKKIANKSIVLIIVLLQIKSLCFTKFAKDRAIPAAEKAIIAKTEGLVWNFGEARMPKIYANV